MVQETGVEMELEENMPLLEWLANNYKTFGAQLEIITDRWGEMLFLYHAPWQYTDLCGSFSVIKSVTRNMSEKGRTVKQRR